MRTRGCWQSPGRWRGRWKTSPGFGSEAPAAPCAPAATGSGRRFPRIAKSLSQKGVFDASEAASYQPRGKGATSEGFALPVFFAPVPWGSFARGKAPGEGVLLQILRRGSRAVLWVVIIGVGGVFVLYLGFQGGFSPAPGSGPVVSAGGFSFDGRDLERIRRSMEVRYREALGEQFDSEAARGFLVESAGRMLQRSALLAWQGERMGLTASDAEIRDYLRGSGLVGADGQLDRDRITQYAESEFGSVRRFQERLRADLLAEKMAGLIRDSAAVSDAEARDAVRYQLEEVKIAAVRFDGRTVPPELELPEGAAEALIQQDPERVRKGYEARKSEFDRPEQAQIRHILARFEQDDDAAKQAARARIDAIRKRIEGGVDFAAVASEA
ncbi:MAG: hypothetical protein E4H11_09435, partial [Myxococcales bacterium]